MFGYAMVTFSVRTEAPSDAIAAQQRLTDHFIHSLRNIKEGRYYTIVTSAFMHANLGHLGLNMLALWGFGRLAVSMFGVPSFLVLYFGSIIAGGMAQNFYWERKKQWSAGGVGASGGVSGVFAAAACALPHGRMSLLIIPMPLWIGAALMVVMSVGGMQEQWLPSFAHADHLGGMAFGALYWLVALRRGRLHRWR
jgi:membrane associated rhomboid family serine protease